MRAKRVVALIASVLLALPLATACSSKGNTPRGSYDSTYDLKSAKSGTVASNKRFTLLWDEQTKSVFFQDKQTSKIWGTVPYEYYFSGASNADLQLYSPITIEYIEPVNDQVKTLESYSGVMKGRIVAKAIENGVQVTYCYDQQQIAVPVQYLLREDSVEVRIMVADIIEGDNRIYQIHLAPFLASVANDTEGGYLFVPSGSGALMTTDTASHEQRTFRDDVYGKDPTTNNTEQPKMIEPIRLPVFGATDGENALMGIIEKGAEYAWIQAQAGYENIGYAGVGSGFRVRGAETIYVPALYGTYSQTPYYASNVIDMDYVSVGYYPLSGDKANYVGMAEAYADYLVKSGGMPEKGETPQLFLEFLGGALCRQNFLGFPYQSVQASTTFTQVREILQDIGDSTGASPVVKLTGFGNAGLDAGKIAGGYTFHNRMGGEKGYKTLLEYCSTNQLSLFADFDLINFRQSGSGFSTNFNSAQKVSGVVAYQYIYSPMFQGYREEFDYTYRLLSRGKLGEAVQKLIKKSASLGVTGISLESLGKTAYSDYSEVQYQIRGRMGEEVAQWLADIREAGHPLLTTSPNDYAAVNSDFIAGSPANSARFDAVDEDVPFYQLVFRGRIPIALSPINMAGDVTKRYLQAIETGSGLYFSLTDTYDRQFIRSTQNALLASVYEDNRDDILSMIEESAAFYQAVDGCKIVGHIRLEEGVTRTDFDNGVSVVVNQTDHPAATPLGTVDGHSFIYVE